MTPLHADSLITYGELMTDRDQQIIQLTDRYRIGTNAAYQKALFGQQSLNAVSKVTARMCRQGWLQRYPLVPPEDYFTLGPKAVRQFGYSKGRTEPLGPQALPIDYAVLLYATHGERTRLLPNELRDFAPWLPDDLCHAPFCSTSRGVLELIRVDLGGSPQHVARKTASDCSKRMEVTEFRQLVVDRKFQLVVLTTTTAKARLIRQAIEGLPWEANVQLHIAAISKLTFIHLRNQ